MQGGLGPFETHSRHSPAAFLRMTFDFDGIKENRHPEEARSAVSKDAQRLSKLQTETLPASRQTGEGRYPRQRWIPTCVGMTKQGAGFTLTAEAKTGGRDE